MIEHPLAAIERGWFVFPLAPGTKVPPRGENGQKSASNERVQVEAWWNDGVQYGEYERDGKTLPLVGNSKFNYAVATGLSGLVIVDIDVPKDEHKDTGSGDVPDLFGGDAWSSMVFNNGLQKQPRTYEVWTPSGGEHLYFQANDALPIKTAASKLAPGIDIRATNGSIVGAGSIIPDKGTYEIHRDLPPKPLPSWLRAELGRVGLAMSKAEIDAKPQVESKPLRNVDNYAKAAYDDELAQLGATPIGSGQRNEALNRAAFKLRKFVEAGQLDAVQVAQALYDTATGKLNMNGNEAEATIRSGLGVK